jgi:hypothetical protein
VLTLLPDQSSYHSHTHSVCHMCGPVPHLSTAQATQGAPHEAQLEHGAHWRSTGVVQLWLCCSPAVAVVQNEAAANGGAAAAQGQGGGSWRLC